MTGRIETDLFANRVELKELRVAHRQLDQEIAELGSNTQVDQLLITRLKRRKLRLKDLIVKLESALIPNLNA